MRLDPTDLEAAITNLTADELSARVREHLRQVAESRAQAAAAHEAAAVERGRAEVRAAVEARLAQQVRDDYPVWQQDDIRAALGGDSAAAVVHDCKTCANCTHNDNKCCGCYDGWCCRDTALGGTS